MAQVIGADIAELRGLATQFDHAAQRFEALASQVGHGVRVSAWVGSVAVRFRLDWDSAHSVAVRNAADSLSDQAHVLRQQADQQEAASASLAGHAGGTVIDAQRSAQPGWLGDGGVDGLVVGGWEAFRKAWDDAGIVTSPAGIIEDMVKHGAKVGEKVLIPSKFLRGVDHVLGPLGLVMDGATTLDGVNSGDVGKTTVGSIGLALDMIGLFPPAAPVAIFGKATLLFASTVLPTDQAGYDGTYELAMQRQFGSSYTPGHATQEQADWGTHRYEGGMGFLASVSDGMNYKANEFGKWFGGLFGGGK